jgi:hypothetical protein
MKISIAISTPIRSSVNFRRMSSISRPPAE